jgi:hypothetical protein
MDAIQATPQAVMQRVRMTADRQGWFWPTPLAAGQEYDLPADVANYLVEVGAALLIADQPPASTPRKRKES